jgi:hypothetical protein
MSSRASLVHGRSFLNSSVARLLEDARKPLAIDEPSPNETGAECDHDTAAPTILKMSAAAPSNAATFTEALGQQHQQWRVYGQARRQWLVENDAAAAETTAFRMNAACSIHKYFALAERVCGTCSICLLSFK